MSLRFYPPYNSITHYSLYIPDYCMLSEIDGEIAYFLRERAKAHLCARLVGSGSVGW